MTYLKPLPVIDDQSRPYWQAARAHEIRLPKCADCAHVRAQFERWCPRCGCEQSTWEKMSGRGHVWSFCAFHRPYFPAFEPEIPYNVAMVQLDEGPRLITNLVEIDRNAIRIGMPVEVAFDDVTPEVTLVKFRPVRAD